MTRELFAISTFCSVYDIEYEFIHSLQSEGLISVTENDEGEFIEEEQLPNLELYARWHHDLGINPAGIDAIQHLVQRIRVMQEEINSLKSKLKAIEQDDILQKD